MTEPRANQQQCSMPTYIIPVTKNKSSCLLVTFFNYTCSLGCLVYFHMNKSLYTLHTGPLNVSGEVVWADRPSVI